ncbi:DUF5999 family protein [Streptomyces nanhaiensis]|uniref:DUF5999 family protein n=1 Tax=Streptomyces nanhaiensis TaxID=679319 RepID=UPI00399CD912
MYQLPPPRPRACSAERGASHLVAHFPQQGWALRSDGAVLFEDTGELLPDGRVVPPHRPAVSEHTTAGDRRGAV